MTEDVVGAPGERLSEVLSKPLVEFEKFPTPAQLRKVRVKLHAIDWAEQRVDASLMQPEFWSSLIEKGGIRRIGVLIAAAINQRAILDADDLPWPIDVVMAQLDVNALGDYLPALIEAYGQQVAADTTQAATDAGATAESEGARPTPAPTPKGGAKAT